MCLDFTLLPREVYVLTLAKIALWCGGKAMGKTENKAFSFFSPLTDETQVASREWQMFGCLLQT